MQQINQWLINLSHHNNLVLFFCFCFCLSLVFTNTRLTDWLIDWLINVSVIYQFCQEQYPLVSHFKLFNLMPTYFVLELSSWSLLLWRIPFNDYFFPFMFSLPLPICLIMSFIDSLSYPLKLWCPFSFPFRYQKNMSS